MVSPIISSSLRRYLPHHPATCYLRIEIIYVILSVCFMLNPAVTTIGTLLLSFFANDKRFAPIDVVFLFLFMWLAQSTRSFHLNEPSDWAGNFYINFSNIGKKSFIDYIFLTGKEYAWQIENYIGYLIWGKFLPYANFLVALTYGFTFLSCYVYWKHSRRSIRTLVASLALFAFITEVSMLSNNLLRQQFAMSMMLYVIVTKAVHHKINWALLVIAVFTHSMTMLFVPFLFVKTGIRPSWKMLFLSLAGLAAFAVLFRLASSFSGIYVLDRLNSSTAYTGTDVMGTSAVYPFLVVTLVLYGKIVILDRCRSTAALSINNLFLLLILLCLAFQSMPLMQVRYFITRFFFMPLVIPYFFQPSSRLNSPYLLAVTLFFLMRYCSTDNFWLASMDDLFTRNLFQYLF